MNKSEAIERVDQIVKDFTDKMRSAKSAFDEEIDRLEKDCEALTAVENLQIIGYLTAEIARAQQEFEA